MRVLHLCDELFFLRESSLLRRLRVGLVDEGVRLATAVPDRVADRTMDLLSGPIVAYSRDRLLIGRGLRQRRLLERIREAASWPGDPQIIHCFGGGSWALGDQLARRTSSVLVLELWRRGLTDRVRSLRTWQSGTAQHDGLILNAPWRGIEAEAQHELPEATVRRAPWGVHVSGEAPGPRRPGPTKAIILAGGRHSPTRLLRAFEGCAELIAEGMDLILFADALGSAAAGLWHHAEEAGLTSRLSVIADLEIDRALPLEADALVYAGNPGEARTLILDAMRADLPVVAGDDPMNETLLDRRTALVVHEPERGGWRGPIETALTDDAQRAELCASARDWVRRNHRVSVQVASIYDAYETSLAAATGTAARIGAEA